MEVNSFTLVFEEMKSFIIKILVFFGVVALIDFAFGSVCNYLYFHSKGGDTYKINYAVQNNCSDVLVMGSSRANHHYNPDILADGLGVTVYNLGIDGSGAILADGLYRMISERYCPKYIVYELTPSFDFYHYSGDANNTRYLSQLKPYYKERSISGVFDDIDRFERLKLNSGLYRYNTTFLNLIRFYLQGGETGNGYSPLTGTMKTFVEKKTIEDSTIDSLKIKYLEQFISDCKRNGTQLFFVISPMYGAESSSEYNPGIEICEKNGYVVFDHFCDMQEMKYFNDSYHLNSLGSDAFSKQIAEEIKQHM